MIPKIVHQIWVGPNDKPEYLEGYSAKLKELHPDWDCRLWTEDSLPTDLLRTEYLDKLRAPAERADLLRLELLYRFGGLYIDIDMVPLRPMDPILEMGDFVICLAKADRTNNAFMAAKPSLDLVRHLIESGQPTDVFGYSKKAFGPFYVVRMFGT